ncbi:MAG TPA: PH domain-containing protein [Candidatus Limnocylindrales bacterium]
MSYAQSLLAKEEHIVYEARQHWLAPLADSLRPIVLVLVGLLILGVEINMNWTGLPLMLPGLLLLVGIVWIVIIVLTWRAEEYIITTRRVLKVEGLLDKKTGDSSLDKINDAVLVQGIWARIFHYGDLEILTAAETAIDRYTMLSRVVEFKKAMLNAKNTLDDGFRGLAATPSAASPAGKASSADVTATLAQLAELRDKGAITVAEFEKKKADLLGRI